MKKQELTDKSDKEKKGQVLRGRSAQRGSELGGNKLEDYLQQIGAEGSPDSFLSILTAPEFSHPINASEKAYMISHLQQTYGNRYVQRAIQAKLKIGQPNDKYEQEADQVADEVMRMPEPQVREQLKEEEKGEEEIIRAKEDFDQNSEVTATLESGINATRGRGQPLRKSLRDFFEPRFDHNFRQVFIHADSNSDRLANEIGAKAFAIGNDIFFRKDAYQPYSEAGKNLLGHELTHVVQQSKVPSASLVRITGPSEIAETEAKIIAQMLISGNGISVVPRTEIIGAVARQKGGEVARPATEEERPLVPIKEVRATKEKGEQQTLSSWSDTSEGLSVAKYGEELIELGYDIAGYIKGTKKYASSSTPISKVRFLITPPAGKGEPIWRDYKHILKTLQLIWMRIKYGPEMNKDKLVEEICDRMGSAENEFGRACTEAKLDIRAELQASIEFTMFFVDMTIGFFIPFGSRLLRKFLEKKFKDPKTQEITNTLFKWITTDVDQIIKSTTDIGKRISKGMMEEGTVKEEEEAFIDAFVGQVRSKNEEIRRKLRGYTSAIPFEVLFTMADEYSAERTSKDFYLKKIKSLVAEYRKQIKPIGRTESKWLLGAVLIHYVVVRIEEEKRLALVEYHEAVPGCGLWIFNTYISKQYEKQAEDKAKREQREIPILKKGQITGEL